MSSMIAQTVAVNQQKIPKFHLLKNMKESQLSSCFYGLLKYIKEGYSLGFDEATIHSFSICSTKEFIDVLDNIVIEDQRNQTQSSNKKITKIYEWMDKKVNLPRVQLFTNGKSFSDYNINVHSPIIRHLNTIEPQIFHYLHTSILSILISNEITPGKYYISDEFMLMVTNFRKNVPWDKSAHSLYNFIVYSRDNSLGFFHNTKKVSSEESRIVLDDNQIKLVHLDTLPMQKTKFLVGSIKKINYENLNKKENTLVGNKTTNGVSLLTSEMEDDELYCISNAYPTSIDSLKVGEMGRFLDVRGLLKKKDLENNLKITEEFINNINILFR